MHPRARGRNQVCGRALRKTRITFMAGTLALVLFGVGVQGAAVSAPPKLQEAAADPSNAALDHHDNLEYDAARKELDAWLSGHPADLRAVTLNFLWIGLALLIVLPACRARAAGQEEQEVRSTILKAMANWSALDADSNAAYYTSSDGAVFFDFTPMQYVGWETYKNEIKKVQESIRNFTISVNDDLSVKVVGPVAWAHATWKMDFDYKDGTHRHLEGRLTEVLEKQGGKWKIVHEHASVPMPPEP